MFWPTTQPRSLIACQSGAVDRLACSSGLSTGPNTRLPIRAVFPASCAPAASGARTRLTARTTASPITRMGTSIGTAGGESSRTELWAVGRLQGPNLSFFGGCVQYLYRLLSFSLILMLD